MGELPYIVNRKVQLLQHLAAIRKRVEAARVVAGRDKDTISILPVSKYHPSSDIRYLSDMGIKNFGESMHQSVVRKISELENIPGRFFSPYVINWHMIGQVQSNKAKGISQWAYAVHSVDRPKIVKSLAAASQRALDLGERVDPIRVYLQLSLDGDPERGGAEPDTILAMAEKVTEKSSLILEGLMVVPPISWERERAFAQAADFRKKFLADFPQSSGFSAGMSDDLEIAIAYGSTCLRVGTAIFGSHALTSSQENNE